MAMERGERVACTSIGREVEKHDKGLFYYGVLKGCQPPWVMVEGSEIRKIRNRH